MISIVLFDTIGILFELGNNIFMALHYNNSKYTNEYAIMQGSWMHNYACSGASLCENQRYSPLE